MLNTIKGIWNSITDVVESILSAALLLLPDSPFASFEIPEIVRDILGYVNYFVPISAMLVVGTSWLAAIGIYYAVQTVLRWTKSIK